MLFADNIVLIDETREVFDNKLEQWREIPEAKGLRPSWSNTEYLKIHGIFKMSIH